MSTLGNAPDRQPDTGELAVTAASSEDWHQVAQWAADEDWNPGLGDTACFHPTDPAGFFLGRRAGRTVSAVSIVTYSDAYAFLGYYLVHPDHRGQGLGLATWRAAFPHAGVRTVGLDAVPAQQATYRRAGFTPAHDTIRYAGRPLRPGHTGAGGGRPRHRLPPRRRRRLRPAVLPRRPPRLRRPLADGPRPHRPRVSARRRGRRLRRAPPGAAPAIASARSSPTPPRPPRRSSTPSSRPSTRAARSSSTSPGRGTPPTPWPRPAAWLRSRTPSGCTTVRSRRRSRSGPSPSPAWNSADRGRCPVGTAPAVRTTGHRPAGGTAHGPTVPSMASRRKSAWPLWRAYSWIRCSITRRRETCSPQRGW